jgi:hypothetical protein
MASIRFNLEHAASVWLTAEQAAIKFSRSLCSRPSGLKGRQITAQGQAQRRPGKNPQTANALKGRQNFAGIVGRYFVTPLQDVWLRGPVIPGRRFARPWAVISRPFGAAGLGMGKPLNIKRTTLIWA